MEAAGAGAVPEGNAPSGTTDGGAGREARPPAWWPVALAYAAFVLVGLFAGVGGVLLPAQIDDYGVDKATIGVLFFPNSAGFVLAGATAGGLINRLGFRAALAVGGVVLLGAALGTAARPPFAVLVLLQIPVGYGIGVLESVLNAYLAGLPRAATRLNRLHAFFGVGALLGPLFAAWLLRFAPWTAVWLVLAVAVVPLVAGFLTGYPRPASPEVTPAADGASGPGSTDAGPPGPRAADAGPRSGESGRPRPPRNAGAGLLTATLRQRGVWFGAVLLAVYVGLELSVGNWAFSYLVEARGQADLTAGYTVSGFWLGLTLGRFLISPVATRVGLSTAGMSTGCLVAVTVTAALVWLLPGAPVAVAGLVTLGFFLGPIFPTTMAVVPEVTEARLVPTAIGVMNAGSVVGGAVLPWLAGAVAQQVGVWSLLPYAVALALLQSLVWWRMAALIRPRPAVAGRADPSATPPAPPPAPRPDAGEAAPDPR